MIEFLQQSAGYIVFGFALLMMFLALRSSRWS